MQAVIQVNNTLPLHLKINFTKGPKSNTSIFLGRNSKMNISLAPTDVFDVVWSRNSQFVFLNDISANSSEIDQDERILLINETCLKSIKGDGNSNPFPLNLEHFNYYKFNEDGSLDSTAKTGDNIMASTGEVYKMVLDSDDKGAQGHAIGYFSVDPKLTAAGDFSSWINFSFSSFGHVSDTAYSTPNGTKELAYRLPNYNPGLLLEDGKGVNLHENQIILYDQEGTLDKDKGTYTFPDGANFIAIDSALADVSSILTTVGSYFGEDSFSIKMIQFGPNTAIDTFAQTGFNGDKTTLKPNSGQWLSNPTSFASFQFLEIESQAQAHMHVLCDLVEGLSHDKDKDNPTHFRVNVKMAPRSKSKDKNGNPLPIFPKVRFQIANQEDINSDFSQIVVNGTSYSFDGKTNQTDYIAPNTSGQLIASWNPSPKRTGAPQLYLHSESMPAHAAVWVAPALSMNHRMGNMVNAKGEPDDGFSDFIKKKAKAKKINLSDKQAGQIKDITQHLQKSVLHGFKHTLAGNQSHHVVEGAAFTAKYEAVQMDFTNPNQPKFTPHSKGSGGAALALAELFDGPEPVVQWLGSGLVHDLGKAEGAVVAGAKDLIKSGKHITDKALETIKHLESVVEDVLVAVVKTAEGVAFYAIQAADEIAAVVSKIYDAIKVAIEDIVDYFKFLYLLFKEIPKIYDGIKSLLDTTYNKYLSSDIIKKIKKEANKVLDDGLKTIEKNIGLPTKVPGKNYKGHKSSDPNSESAKEKLQWLLIEVLHLVQESAPNRPQGAINKMLTKLKEDAEDEFIIFLTDKFDKFITDDQLSKDPYGFADSFFSNFSKDLKTLLVDVLNKWKDTIEKDLDDVLDKMDKNPLDQPILQDISPCFQGDTLKKFLSLLGLDGKIAAGVGVSPAEALALTYAVPAGIAYALIKTEDNNLEGFGAQDNIFSDPILMDIMAVLSDISGGIGATINVVKGVGGESASLPDLVKILLQGFGIIDASIKLIQIPSSAKKTPASIVENIMRSITIGRIMLGFISARGVESEAQIPLAKAQCAIDVVAGIIGMDYAIVSLVALADEASKKHPAWKYSAVLFESLSKYLEMAVVDEDPDSRTAMIIFMDFFRAIGGILRVVDLFENK